MEPILRINRFDVGTVDNFATGKAPDGSFLDSKNLLPTREGCLESAYGFDGDLITMPDGPPTTGASLYTILHLSAHPYPFSGESPVAHDGRVYFFASSGLNHIGIKPWYRNSATAQTGNQGIAWLEEKRYFTAVHTTISGSNTNIITVTAANADHNLSTTNDYYNHWRIEWYHDGSYEYAFVVDYSYTAGTDTAVITVLEGIGSSEMNWVALEPGDDHFIIRRWFHAPENMVPTFTSKPGKCFQVNNRVYGCGGASSDEDHFPWVAQYIDRTFFGGETEEVHYQGTYIDQVECVPMSGVVYNLLAGTLSTPAYPTGYQYSMSWTLEYDGYEESRLGAWTAPVTIAAGNDYIVFDVKLQFARMSKRVTAVNVYMRETVSGVTGQAYFIKRIPITGTVDSDWSFELASNWGYWIYDGATTNLGSVFYSEWSARGSTYYQRTGRLEEESGDRHVVSWKYAEVINDRTFVANFYDPNESTTFVDEVRFSCLGSQGIGTFPYDRTNYEFSIGRGTSEEIKGLTNANGWLTIWKNGSIHAKYINSPYPEEWPYNLVSSHDGLSSEDSLVVLPDGMTGFADTDGYKVLRNQRVFSITEKWKNTYKAFTTSSVIAWYDRIDRSLRITNGIDTTNRNVYVIYPEMDGFPMYRLQLPATNYVQYVAVEMDGTVLFANALTNGPLCKWGRTYYDYDGSAIIPYWQSHPIIVDESKEFLIEKFVIIKTGDCEAGTLDNKFYIDATQVLNPSSNPWTSQSKSFKYLFQWLPVNANRRVGKRFQVVYNTNGSGEYSASVRPRLEQVDIYGVAQRQLEKST